MNLFRAPASVWCVLVVHLLGLAIALGQTTTPPSALDPPKTQSVDISALRAKAEAGDAAAQFQLGKAYEGGNGIPNDDALAVVWFKKAADQNYPAAANGLGVMHAMGRGVEKSKEEATSWYQKAAKLGSPEAMFNLGACYYNGDGVVENQIRAFAWFLLAQDGGDVAARDAARRSSVELAQSPTGSVILEIGAMYEKGDGLPQSYADAARWYRKGAGENVQAAMNLAALLIDGKSVKQDYVEAMNICRDAAKKSYGPAEFCVGYLYRQGYGVPIDAKEAAKWYERASTHGHGPAQLALAEMYLKGEGVGVDRPEAYRLLFLAYRNRVLQVPAHKGSILQAKSWAHTLRQEMNKDELKTLDKKLRAMRLDPQQVYALIDDPTPPDISRQMFPPVVR